MESNLKETSTDKYEENELKELYDDGNIPEIDTENVYPDEVPRRDGPGGE